MHPGRIRMARAASAPMAICGPLMRGGPARLAEECGFTPEEGYVDACHLCYLARKSMLAKHPQCLAPPQAYGL